VLELINAVDKEPSWIIGTLPIGEQLSISSAESIRQPCARDILNGHIESESACILLRFGLGFELVRLATPSLGQHNHALKF
jgi:hypothetical protein